MYLLIKDECDPTYWILYMSENYYMMGFSETVYDCGGQCK